MTNQLNYDIVFSMNNIEREPDNTEFTYEELMVLHRGLVNEQVEAMVPINRRALTPREIDRLDVVRSAMSKLHKLIQENRYGDNE